jgi:hypothetical protein
MHRVMSEDLGSLADIAGANSDARMAFGDVASIERDSRDSFTETGSGCSGTL